MMSLVIRLLLYAHIASAAGLIIGVAGRNIALALARRAGTLPALDRCVQIAGQFERTLVIPGSNIVFLTGLVLAWLQGWPILGFLQGSRVNWVLVALLLYMATIPLVVCVFLPRGKIFEQALAAAHARGQITAELCMALRDRAVGIARGAEYAIAVAILYLMIARPI